MSSIYSGFIIAFLTAVIHVVNSSGSIEFRLISSRSCNVKLCVKKPRAKPMDSCLLESRRISLYSQQQRVVSTPFHFPFPDRFILVTEVYDVIGVLLSNSTSKETFIIGTEFNPAVGSSDFLDIAFRSSCDASYYGSGCQRYCKPSFSYTCDINGMRICAIGWSGEQCDQLKFLVLYSIVIVLHALNEKLTFHVTHTILKRGYMCYNRYEFCNYANFRLVIR
ncbi:delta serrate ligand [Dictyocaulus viviparus]|uniref:Delta-like protein n=1 Tax=Dictyocaulus viviparus TaxID=29172 RepID=A0A0D8XHK7_DICVI|nr:delta serrate ligand [Dictyocaulus viviparus]